MESAEEIIAVQEKPSTSRDISRQNTDASEKDVTIRNNEDNQQQQQMYNEVEETQKIVKVDNSLTNDEKNLGEYTQVKNNEESDKVIENNEILSMKDNNEKEKTESNSKESDLSTELGEKKDVQEGNVEGDKAIEFESGTSITEKNCKLKDKGVDITIIQLSDGEEDQSTNTTLDAELKAAKVQKRRSVGSVGQQTNYDDHLRLKRRKINVEGAPKMPLTGYVRYMNDRRDALRKEQPNKTSMEHTKIIAEEWQNMTSELKVPYIQAAELDKQRYVEELHTFLKSRPDVLASELAKNKPRRSLDSITNISLGVKEATPESTMQSPEKEIIKEKNSTLTNSSNDNQKLSETSCGKSKTSSFTTISLSQPIPLIQPATTVTGTTPYVENTSNSTTTSSIVGLVKPTPSEIPIFTNEFLEHNKLYDTELKTLRKTKIELEQQNAVLEKYVENMKNGLNKITNENNELQEKNRLLEVYLDKLKKKLSQALHGLPLPNVPKGATIDNIDQYMKELYSMANTNTHGPAILNKAKDIIRKLDLQIQL